MFGACGGGTILVLPGMITVLFAAGAPPIRRTSHTIAGLVTVVRSSYFWARSRYVQQYPPLPNISHIAVATTAVGYCFDSTAADYDVSSRYRRKKSRLLLLLLLDDSIRFDSIRFDDGGRV